MPWTKEDASRFKADLSDDQREQWAAIANDVLERCLNEGGTQDECEEAAIRQASGVVGNSAGCLRVHHGRLKANYDIRYEEFLGRRHVVVPVTLMVEGVHDGSDGPTLYTRQELSKYPASWNGRPIPVYHPEDEIGPISCNDPQIIQERSVGQLFGVHYTDGKLRGEAWIDEERARRISPATMARVENGEPLEVSTGVFTEDERVQGNWNGETYHAIARNLRPDHLALLPDEVGACSLADGCGIRANRNERRKNGGGNVLDWLKNLMGGRKRPKLHAVRQTARTPNYDGTSSGEWNDPSFSDCVAGYYKHHTDAPRPDDEVNEVGDAPQALKDWTASLSLLGNGNADNYRELSMFMVVNPDTLELHEGALDAVISGRGEQAEIPDEAKRSAQRKAYELLNREFNRELEVPDNLSANKDHPLKANAADGSYFDLIHRAQGKLDSMDSPDRVHFLEDMTDGSIIYRVENHGTNSSRLFRVSYTLTDNGRIEFGGEPVEVVSRTDYVEVDRQEPQGMFSGGGGSTKSDGGQSGTGGQPETQNEGEQAMEKVDRLIQNSKTKFKDEDRSWLQNLTECQLDKLFPGEDGGTEPQQLTGNSEVDEETKRVVKALQQAGKDEESFIQLMPYSLQEQMRSGLKLHRQRREQLIGRITQNSNAFTQEELEGKDVDELEKLAQLVKPKANYYPLGGGEEPATGNSKEPEPLLPTDVQSEKEE